MHWVMEAGRAVAELMARAPALRHPRLRAIGGPAETTKASPARPLQWTTIAWQRRRLARAALSCSLPAGQRRRRGACIGSTPTAARGGIGRQDGRRQRLGRHSRRASGRRAAAPGACLGGSGGRGVGCRWRRWSRPVDSLRRVHGAPAAGSAVRCPTAKARLRQRLTRDHDPTLHRSLLVAATAGLIAAGRRKLRFFVDLASCRLHLRVPFSLLSIDPHLPT